MQQSFLYESPVFVLGLQRSGTTWLANIFDSSPETLLLFEPFAPQYNIFEQFPHEFFYVAPPSPFLSNLLKEKLPDLVNYKSVLFKRSDIGYLAFSAERFIMRSLLQMDRIVRSSRLEFARQYQLLNLNRIDDKDLFFPKRKTSKTLVIKELRLSGKVDLIAHTYPKAKFILIVRHPVAVVHSILTWFKKGHLGELRHNLDIYAECMASQVVFQPYLDKIEFCKNKGIEYKLALHWLLNTEITLKQFKENDNAKIVIYENLAKNPSSVTQDLFKFVGIKFEHQVEIYLNQSSTNSLIKTGVIDTVRKSATYYKQWQNQVPKSIQQAVLEIAGDSVLLPEIERCYE